MKKIKSFIKQQFHSLSEYYNSLYISLRTKLIVLFIFVKVLPLLLIVGIAWKEVVDIEFSFRTSLDRLDKSVSHTLDQTSDIAITNSFSFIEDRATNEIERTSTDLADRVATLLYSCDSDILFASLIEPNESTYQKFINTKVSKIVDAGDWVLSDDNSSWVQQNPPAIPETKTSSIKNNELSFNYNPPQQFQYKNVPLYLEMTYLSTTGQELIKVVSSDRMSPIKKDVSNKQNTYVKSETYFEELKNLKAGEIYVSDVIGEYVGSKIIGMYTPENAATLGVDYQPEKEAYAGKENPNGVRFEGIVRFATPVVQNGVITGYVTLALNHDHIMELMEHIMPTDERYTVIADAYKGNYAFIWDHKGRSIVHPRHHSIAGYNADTGEPQTPWLEQSIYDDWQASGKSYTDFIKDVPTFDNQTTDKKGSSEQIKQGLVGLDCRYLNHAPQCTGWFDLTSDGGSGSFLILWSGLRKLTTAAAIPYYTAQYGQSGIGFGFVAVGAGIDDFYRPAIETRTSVNNITQETIAEISNINEEAHVYLTKSIKNTATSFILTTTTMIILVIWLAIFLASLFTNNINAILNGFSTFRKGYRDFRFTNIRNDELGKLEQSFNEIVDNIKESVSDPQVIIDKNRKIIYANEFVSKWFSYVADGLIGKQYNDYTFYDIGSSADPILAYQEGRIASLLYNKKHNAYFQANAKPLLNDDGEIQGYVITTHDLTDLISTEESLERHRLLLDTIFNSSPDLIWLKDAKTLEYILINEKFASLYGFPVEDYIGKTADDFIAPELLNTIKSTDEHTLLSGSNSCEATYSFADGHTEVVSIVRTPIYDKEGNLTRILGIGRDITERLKFEQRLVKTSEDLDKALKIAESASAAKSTFLANMSHEIRTPMNAIISLSNVIKSELESNQFDHDKTIEYISHIEKSSQHLLGLLNDILDASKIEAGKMELDISSFSIQEMVKTVDVIISPKCDEKSQTFDINLDDNITQNVLSDSLRIKQVLINLLGNSLKFTPENGYVTLNIKLISKTDDTMKVDFSVIDTGIGIEKTAIKKLFDPFEQADTQTTSIYGGTGLGLSISNSIVNMLGGNITVDSKINESTTFSFTLTLDIDKSTEVNNVKQDANINDTNIDISNKNILIADDVELNRLVLRELLKPYQFNIDEVVDGLQAFETFRDSNENYYDIILMDIQMPNMSGYESTEAIRKLDSDYARNIPIIAITANAFKEDIEKALTSGMNAHVMKPINLEKLVTTMKELIANSKQS